MNRNVILFMLTSAAVAVVIIYGVSFLPAPEWRWQRGWFGYERFSAGGWPNRAITISSDQTKMYFSIQTGNFWIEHYAYLSPSANGSNVPMRELSFAGFILRKSVEEAFVFIPSHSMGGDQVLRYCVRIPLWALFLLFAAYPIAAFFRGPLTRLTRRRRGLCVQCGYNLIGNSTGICPECGTKFVTLPYEMPQRGIGS